MAYTKGTMSLLDQTIEGGIKRWLYITADTLATVQGAGYISNANDLRMQIGDIVWVFSGTLNTSGLTEGAAAFSGTVGLESLFATVPAFEAHIVSTISAGAATVEPTKASVITDNSGGVANAATGIVATLATQTFSWYTRLADLANSQIFETDPGFNGNVVAANFRVRVAATTAAKLATLTAQINGTNVTTGGVIALTSANATPTGAKVAGTAVTAQAFTSSQPIGFNVSSVTAFIEGDGYAELTVVNTDLANAIATLVKF